MYYDFGTSRVKIFGTRNPAAAEIGMLRYMYYSVCMVYMYNVYIYTYIYVCVCVYGHTHTHSTHWGWMTQICVGNLTIIGSDNGLSPERHQAIIWTNAGILWIWPLGTNFSKISIDILTLPLLKKHLKGSSATWNGGHLSRPQMCWNNQHEFVSFYLMKPQFQRHRNCLAQMIYYVLSYIFPGMFNTMNTNIFFVCLFVCFTHEFLTSVGNVNVCMKYCSVYVTKNDMINKCNQTYNWLKPSDVYVRQ